MDVHTIQGPKVSKAVILHTRQQYFHRCRLRLHATRSAGPTALVDAATFDAEAQKSILAEDLQHLFDDKGIDSSLYDSGVDFRDPITKYDNLQGYLFNIGMLRLLFSPTFTLHDLQQTAPWELTSRWTMTMTFLPATATPLKHVWSPRLIFTGTSIYGYNPDTGRINRHWDTWDSIRQQDFFSVEGFKDFLSMVSSPMRPPAAHLSHYTILQRRKSQSTTDPLIYEVRSYPPEQQPPGSAAAYTSFPKASSTPSSPTPALGGMWAALPFPGDCSPEAAAAQERRLRAALKVDGQQAAAASWCLAMHHSSPVPGPCRRNEVLVPLSSFDLWGPQAGSS